MNNETRANLQAWQRQLSNASAEEIVSWAWQTFGSRVAFASSLGLEDQVLTEMLYRLAPQMNVFTLDTGRLYPETYELLQRIRNRYGLKIKIYFPEASEIEELVNASGPDLFRESVEQRKHCCRVRKIFPLRRALAGLDAWICGLRRGQASTRGAVQAVEWDEGNGLVKINPLAAWSEIQTRAYLEEKKVPYNPLHDRGFPSIGCACCTRAVRPGEDIRAGRWWWEAPDKKECGLHGGSVPAPKAEKTPVAV